MIKKGILPVSLTVQQIQRHRGGLLYEMLWESDCIISYWSEIVAVTTLAGIKGISS